MASPRRPRLTAGRIVSEAVCLIEEEGLAALSARRLAQRLRCEAMSLYHHVESMDGLADRIVEQLLLSVADEAEPDPGSAIRQGARAYLRMALDHPNSFPLVATRRWKRAGARARAMRFVELFAAAGSSDPLARARMLGAYLNGAGLALAACQKDDELAEEERERIGRQLDDGIDLLLADLA